VRIAVSGPEDVAVVKKLAKIKLETNGFDAPGREMPPLKILELGGPPTSSHYSYGMDIVRRVSGIAEPRPHKLLVAGELSEGVTGDTAFKSVFD
jgi:hypothetical protein